MSHVLAADIGGTNMRLAMIDQQGRILKESRVQTELSQHSAASQAEAEAHIITTLSQAMQSFLADAYHVNNRDTDGRDAVRSIGIGFPGFFHGDSGVLAASPNLPLLHDFALAELLADALGMTVSVQNDALCAAVGEHRFGAGQGKRNLLHITLGTGVGGGLILNHQPYSGEHGMAMEFGHLCVETHHPRRCGCGNAGCVESYASASAIKQRYSDATGNSLGTKAIYQLANEGDDCAMTIVQQAGAYLGQAIAEAIKLLDISTVTISGGLSKAWPMLYPPMMDALNTHLIPPLRGKVQVLRSTLADNAGLLGAASIATP